MIDIQIASQIRQMISTIIVSGDHILLIDPGYLPKELAEIAAIASSRGEVEVVALTHGHFEHVMGHSIFPEITIWISEALAREIEGEGKFARESLENARQFDMRRKIQRRGSYQWPSHFHRLSDGEQLLIGDITVEALSLPGHSFDSMGLFLEENGLLVAGDYLSPLEIPHIENFPDYYRTLHRLISLLDGGVTEVIPGHGWKISDVEAREIAKDDLSYLYQMMFFRDSGDFGAMRHMLLPRSSDEAKMRKQHVENCRVLGVEFEE